jgi:hypothetical protein
MPKGLLWHERQRAVPWRGDGCSWTHACAEVLNTVLLYESTLRILVIHSIDLGQINAISKPCFQYKHDHQNKELLFIENSFNHE